MALCLIWTFVNETADFWNKASQEYRRLITNEYQFLVQVKANQKVILAKVTTESVAADV